MSWALWEAASEWEAQELTARLTTARRSGPVSNAGRTFLLKVVYPLRRAGSLGLPRVKNVRHEQHRHDRQNGNEYADVGRPAQNLLSL